MSDTDQAVAVLATALDHPAVRTALEPGRTVNGHGRWCASLHAPPGITYACDCNEEGSG